MRTNSVIGALLLLTAVPAFAEEPAVAVQPGEQVAQAPTAVVPPPVLVPGTLNWTGPYIGMQFGAGQLKDTVTETATKVPALTGTGDLTGFNGTFGGHAGYNWQSGRIVFGPEADFETSFPTRSSTCQIENAGVGNAKPGTCFPTFGYGYDTRIRWQGSIRGRIGFLVGDALFYATGGGALGDVATSYTQSIPGVVAAGQSFEQVRPGYTAGAGLEYALTDNWHVRVEYRYTDFGTESNALTTAGPFWNGYTEHHRIDEQTVRLGVTYLFGAPPPPAPVMPAAAPMAAPPPPARVFLVFFDWDRDIITPQGMQVVEKAADAYRSGTPVRLMVTGYTDRSGSPGYNQRLSERRANNVAKALQGMGVPRDQMGVSGKGENDNRVPTAPGVREPQNRRVEIVFS